ncbi:unnamed protein product, partial [Ascophyllum nodosum]
METLLTQRGSKDWSLLSAAAVNENKASFKAVLEAIRTRLIPDQVKSLILPRDKDGFPVLYYASIGSSVEKFRAVMVAVSAELTPEEVSDMLRYKDSVFGSLLAVAARLCT